MQPAADRKSKAGAADGFPADRDRPLAAAPPSSALAPAAPEGPTRASANFVSPAWRKKYITPEVFRRRVYAYFGRRPSKSTLHRWLQSGRFSAVRVGKFWLIPESAWDEFLARARGGLQF
jgi:excisionase family DNA binding protein